MAMSLGGGSGQQATINVTPLIDVLLVLLIIFMVITPPRSTGLNALVPQPPDRNVSPPQNDIVISVPGNGTVRLNQEVVDIGELGERLKTIFKSAANHVIFLRGARELEFHYVAEVIDIAKGVGLDRVALMTE